MNTFEELRQLLERHLGTGNYDVVVQCAAVSDYLSGGIYGPAPGTSFGEPGAVVTISGDSPSLIDRAAGKVRSNEPELWLRLVRAPKLIDMVRSPWGFRGTLVKFKLEVGVSDERLLEIAEKSRLASAADLMVANTLEGASAWAYLGPVAGRYDKIGRRDLAARLLDAIENRS